MIDTLIVFYKFNVNYNDNKIKSPISTGFKNPHMKKLLLKIKQNIPQTETNFKKKFSEIKFVSLNAELSGQEIDKIKQRLTALKENRNCVDSIFKEGAKNCLSKSKISEITVNILLRQGIGEIVGLSNPVAFIAKEFVKGFASGSILADLNCLI